MGWLANLFGSEKHDATPEVALFGFPTAGGLLPYGVNSTTAVGLSAVWGCLRVLSNAVSQLEWREVRVNSNLDTLPLSRLTRRPEASRTRREWTKLVTSTLALYQVTYLLRGPDDGEGVPLSLMYLPPQVVVPISTSDQFGLAPVREYWVGGTRVSADRLCIIRTGLLPGIPPHLGGLIDLARTTFASAIAAENYASRYWQAGGSPTTIIKTDQALTDDQATELGNRWANKRAQGPDHPAVLGMGADAKDWGANPADAAAVEARLQQVADIARYFGVPTRLVNAPTSDTETYTASGDSNLDLLRFTVQDYIDAIADAISDELPGNRGMTMETTQLTRGSQLARYQAWQLATAGKPWMLPEQVRDEERMAPLDPADLALLMESGKPATDPQGAAPAKLTAPRVG